MRQPDALRLSAASPGHKKFMPDSPAPVCHAPGISGIYRLNNLSAHAAPKRITGRVMHQPILHTQPIKHRVRGAISRISGDFWGCFQTPNCGLFPRHLRAEKTRFLCTHGSLTDPAATRAGRAKSRSKKLCKFVHYCAVKKLLHVEYCRLALS